MATEHRLKTWPEFFQAITDGVKTFEVRVDDRGYAVGDSLVLQEWKPGPGYTGREMIVAVLYMLRIPDTELVVMSIRRMDLSDDALVTQALARELKLAAVLDKLIDLERATAWSSGEILVGGRKVAVRFRGQLFVGASQEDIEFGMGGPPDAR